MGLEASRTGPGPRRRGWGRRRPGRRRRGRLTVVPLQSPSPAPARDVALAGALPWQCGKVILMSDSKPAYGNLETGEIVPARLIAKNPSGKELLEPDIQGSYDAE